MLITLFMFLFVFFFFFNDTATTEIYTLSLHDALPIPHENVMFFAAALHDEAAVQIVNEIGGAPVQLGAHRGHEGDRKSTRLNSSHPVISYAVFCLEKKKREKKEYCDDRMS